MKASVARLAELTGRERRFLVWAACWFVVVRVGLAVTQYRRVVHLLEPVARRGRQSRELSPDRVVRLVHIASNRKPISSTCVPRAVTAWLLLSRQGYAPVIQMGADKHVALGDGLAAHAWVEVDGEPVGEGDDLYEKFVVFR